MASKSSLRRRGVRKMRRQKKIHDIERRLTADGTSFRTGVTLLDADGFTSRVMELLPGNIVPEGRKEK